MYNDLEDEIVIDIDRPKNKTSQDKSKGKKSKKQIAKNQNRKTKNTSKKVAPKATYKKNKKVNKPRKGLKIFLFLILVIGLVCFLMNSNIFTVKKVEVIDNVRVTAEQVEELANLKEYKNLISINTSKIKENILQNAYIEEVKVSRIFPNTVKITVKERTPRYMLQVADSFVYINNQGYMLEISTENIKLPIILGFKTDLSDIETGNRLEVEDLKKLETIIKIVETANVNEVGEYITKIDISDEKNYTLILEGEQKTVYLGDCSNLNTRMLYLNGILKQEKGIAGEIFLNMDLNTEDAYFREQT